MEPCNCLGKVIQFSKNHPDIHLCNGGKKVCTQVPSNLKTADGPIQCCENCEIRNCCAAGEERKSPPLFVKMYNYTTTLVQHALAGFPTVTPEQFKARTDICNDCEAKHPTTMECLECGCPIEDKAAWAVSFCPLKKWFAETSAAKSLGSGCGGCGQSR